MNVVGIEAPGPGFAEGRMPPDLSRSPPPEVYWPAGISVLLVVSGIFVVLADTGNLLVVLGIGLLIAGAYGLLHRRAHGAGEGPVPRATPPLP